MLIFLNTIFRNGFRSGSHLETLHELTQEKRNILDFYKNLIYEALATNLDSGPQRGLISVCICN